MNQIQAARDEKTKFAQDLKALTNAPLKNHFTDFMPTSRVKTTEEKYGGWGDLEAVENTTTVVDEHNLDEDFPQLGGGTSQAAESIAPETESIADSNAAVAESDAGTSVGQASSWVAPHLRGRPGAPTSTAGSSITGYVPPHLRGRPNASSDPAAEPKGKENASSAWAPPPLRGPKHNNPASTKGVDPDNYPKPDEKHTAPVPAWTTQKNLFPEAPPAQKPTEQQLQAATSFNPNYSAWLDVDNPDHPEFSYGRYWCKYSDQYMCPKTRCGKGFKKYPGLIGHLRGPAHKDKKYTCPSCHKDFATLEAVSAHSESASQRCHIRYTDGYHAYLDQLTAGFVDVSFNDHADGTHRYETSVAAIKKWGNADEANKTEMARTAEQKQRDEEARLKSEAMKAEQLKMEEEVRKTENFKAALEARNAEDERLRRARIAEAKKEQYW